MRSPPQAAMHSIDKKMLKTEYSADVVIEKKRSAVSGLYAGAEIAIIACDALIPFVSRLQMREAMAAFR
ncbi:hypothetical protein MHY1_01342 [Methylovirgula sp. HY1]|nr:hypothetical protein MHY1_01342 [Methylovirgula sp. HY1]